MGKLDLCQLGHNYIVFQLFRNVMYIIFTKLRSKRRTKNKKDCCNHNNQKVNFLPLLLVMYAVQHTML